MDRRKIVELARATGAGVLVTLVRVEGSSYRRTGARLLATGSRHAGTISGGCLESEVIRRAEWLAKDGATIERYAMAFDDTSDIPFGLGCGGTVDLLFEPVEAPEGQALFAAMERSLRGIEAVVVSFLPDARRPLRRAIFDPSGNVLFATPGLLPEKLECARGLTPGAEYEGRFVERLSAPQRLVVLGAGDDAQPLVEMAALLGWTVVVAEGRAQLASAHRFPRAERVEVVRQQAASALAITSDDAVVLMTHSYEQDRALLVGVLPHEPKYLGLLGSRHRSSLLLTEAAMMLGRSVAECCERVFAPVGMDLGGDGPEAIALAIVAEIQAVAQGRTGRSRRMSAGEVAEQVDSGGASRYLEVQCGLDAG